MPAMAFGTARTSFDNCTVQQGVEQWLRLGGRHIDTADMYGTQPDVGRALAASSVPRREIFITTKVPGPIGKTGVVDKILHTALPQLGVAYIDLVLIHFPCVDAQSTSCKADASARLETYGALMELRRRGFVRAVGVSNYNDEQLDEVRAEFNESPAVNQVQYHLAYHNDTLLHFAQGSGTVLEAWAPLGGPTVHGKEPTISLGDPRLKALAAKYKMSTAQAVFRWERQKGVVPVTATCSPEHALGDLDSFDAEHRLSEEDIAVMDALMPANILIA